MLFGIPSGDFEHKNCSMNVVLPPRPLAEPVIGVVLISKQILRVRLFLEKVVLNLSIVSDNYRDTLTYLL